MAAPDRLTLSGLRRVLRLGRALTLARASAPGWMSLNFTLVVLQGLLPLASVYVLKLLVDAVVAGLSAPVKSTALRQVVLWVVVAGAIALLAALARTLGGLANQALSDALADHMADALHARSVAVDLEYYESADYYRALHRAQQEAPYRAGRIVTGLAGVGQGTLGLAGIVALLLALDWPIALVLFVASLPGLLVKVVFARKAYSWQRQVTDLERKGAYLHWVLTGPEHAKETRLFGLGSLFRERFRTLRRQLRGERLRLARARALADFASVAVAVAAIFGALVWIASRALAGAITIGDWVLYYQALQRGQAFFQELLGGLGGLYEDSLFMEHLDEFLALEPGITDPQRPIPVPAPMREGIRFEHVSFSYPRSSHKALDDISLVVRPGEKVALVGENGAGKTTLAKLLARLYDVGEGRITLDGKDIRAFRVADLRGRMSVIPQDFVRYQLPAWESIWLGDIGRPADHTAILEAARAGGADATIRALPRGYETPLGRWVEDGEELSAGEWQKLALARAFFRDGTLLVLDEPTSSLDPLAEEEMLTRLSALAVGHTVLLISHRFSTVRLADRIVVLERGRVIEEGTHAELIARAGAYARMWRAQTWRADA
ncbi:MAG TPA: ABC transporter ATP-binding protein [Thermoanaerobaculaceae bacterium]|nr:ABC transporter ATP-binding protein [Thermoanaerobaculaceae bacterium]